MMRSFQRTIWLAFLASCEILSGGVAPAQQREEETVQAAAAVLREALSAPLNRIPQAMLADAAGVAVVPNVIKGSFVVGARHGRGLLFVREAQGAWHAPVFITLTGGNVGWQVGLQASDIVLVFKTQRSIQGILNGKLTLGADVAAAAGPVGRQAAVGTDGRLQAEIYTYSRSRGLFAGISIDGSVLQVDPLATGQYYGPAAAGQPVQVPESALRLTQTIAALTGSGGAAVAVPVPAGFAAAAVSNSSAAPDANLLRDQLVQLSPALFRLLDPQWRDYLALPASLFQPASPPDAEAVRNALTRYDTVANDRQFQTLARRPEFQSVHGLLKHYAESLAPSATDLRLPSPPGSPPR